MSQSKTASSRTDDEYPYTGGSHPDRTGPALVLEALFAATRDICCDIGAEIGLGDAPFTICGEDTPALDWEFDPETAEATNPENLPQSGSFTLYVITPKPIENGVRYPRLTDEGKELSLATFTFQTEVLDADVGSDSFYGRDCSNESPPSEPYTSRAFGPEHEVRISNIVYEKCGENLETIQRELES